MMRNILLIIQKEFLQLMRNKQMLPLIFVMPIIQLLVIVNATTFEIKKVNIHVIDDDYSTSSRRLIEKYISSNYFKIVNISNSDKIAMEDILKNKAKLIIHIPKDFEKSLLTGAQTKVQFLINSEDGAAAGVIQSLASRILLNYGEGLLGDYRFAPNPPQIPTINIRDQYWYNPQLNYKEFMIPGVLGILVTITGLFLSSLNIVREKEIGTIEQINVTPIHKYQFIVGKLVPFWLMGLGGLALGLIVAKIFYDFVILGSIALVFAMASVYLLVVLGGGLLISTASETQPQALFLTFFFNILLILMSGLFTPIESMPRWAQVIAFFDPFSHFVEILRRVLMKGAGFFEIRKQFYVLSIYGIVMIGLSVWRYKKVSN